MKKNLFDIDYNKSSEACDPCASECEKINKKIEIQFSGATARTKITNDPNTPSFDMVRASVNLTVAAILISIATSYKLPLSTTYVTFMVAMGTSLADKAWGRDSAVYRVSGVINVIIGWFLTAITAFLVSGIKPQHMRSMVTL